MTLAAVSTVIGALIVGILIGRRAGARPPAGAAVAGPVVQRAVFSSRHGVVLLNRRGNLMLTNRPAAAGAWSSSSTAKYSPKRHRGAPARFSLRE